MLFFMILCLLGLSFMFFDLIVSAIKLVIILIMAGVKTHNDKKNIERLEESGFLKRKRTEENMKNIEKQNEYKEQILNEQNRITQACLSKLRELRVRYPFADEKLFQFYLTKFPSYSFSELKSLENEIKRSHETNELNMSLTPQMKKVYNISDLDSLEPLEECKEMPLIMRIYKPDNINYLLHIINTDLNNHQLLQSRDYLTIVKTRAKIIEKQKELKEMKLNIKAQDIDEIYNDVDDNIKSFRRNRMGFLE